MLKPRNIEKLSFSTRVPNLSANAKGLSQAIQKGSSQFTLTGESASLIQEKLDTTLQLGLSGRIDESTAAHAIEFLMEGDVQEGIPYKLDNSASLQPVLIREGRTIFLTNNAKTINEIEIRALFNNVKSIIDQLEPGEIEWGNRYYRNIAFIKSPVSFIYLGSGVHPGAIAVSENLLLSPQGVFRSGEDKLVTLSELDESKKTFLENLKCELDNRSKNPEAYQQELSEKIKLFHSEIEIQQGKEREKLQVRNKQLLERGKKLEARNKQLPGLPVDGMSVGKFVDVILKLCKIFRGGEEAKYDALLREDASWIDRIDGISVDSAFASCYLPFEWADRVDENPNIRTEKDNLKMNFGELRDEPGAHSFSPIRNRLIVKVVQGEDQLYRFLIIVKKEEDRPDKELEAYELLASEGIPSTFSCEDYNWNS